MTEMDEKKTARIEYKGRRERERERPQGRKENKKVYTLVCAPRTEKEENGDNR